MRLVLMVIFILSTSVFASSKNHVAVSGSCRKEVYPDRTMINYHVNIISKTHKDSNEKASKIYNSIKESIEKKKLDNFEISTTHFVTQPYQPWENGKQVMKGFETRIGLRVTTSSFEELNHLLTFAVGKEGTTIEGPNPFVSKKSYEKIYKECLEVATQDALEKAKILSHSLKAEVGKVLTITENFNGGPRRPEMYFAKSAMRDSGSGGPEIILGKEEIEVTVNVQFELK
jgi:uncharacterized protein YggE